jgi:hypothetical protein
MKRILPAVVALACLAAAAFAFAEKSIRVDVSQDKPGAEPVHFIPVVGYWVVARDAGKNVLMVDGRQRKRNEPSGGLADKARAIYGARHEEFIEPKAFAYSCNASPGVDDFKSGESPAIPDCGWRA